MRAGTLTLRIGERLVAIAADTGATLALLRERFGDWVDDSQPDIEVAFDLRLDIGVPERDGSVDDTPLSRRVPRPVPQLRHGSRVIARSRSAGDVLDALDAVLGGVLARQDDTRLWVWMRPFVVGQRAVLVDATAPMLVNDPTLANDGIVEAPVWAVALSRSSGGGPPVVCVPAALTRPGDDRRHGLAGLVGVVAEPPAGDAALLARYATRHPSPDWFRTVNSLIAERQLVGATDRPGARRAITRLLR